MLEKLQLIEILSKYGKPEIVGSLALELMAWRDIDIEVSNDNLSKEIVSNVIADLVKQERRRIDFSIIDNRNQKTPKTPRSIYIGMKYFDHLLVKEQSGNNPNLWKIDIHFVLPEDSQGNIRTQQIKNKLTDEKKKIILEIKEILMNSPEHRKTIFSVDVYDAVLDKGIKNLKEFKNYLKELNREL